MNQTGNHTKCCKPPDEFARPLQWAGFYAVGASVYLGLLLLVDLIRILCNRKNLFTPRCFQLNAITLTILTIATKLPHDLTTEMISGSDHLSKLTGSALISTVMANFTLSIGNMDPSSIFSNVVALAILVVTVIVKICIQIKTGVIQKNIRIPHIIVMVFTLLSFLVLVGWALVVPARRRVLEDDLNKNSSLIEKVKGHGNVGEDDEASNKKQLSWWPPADLEELLKRSWLLSLMRRPVLGWPLFHLLSVVSSLLGVAVLCLSFNLDVLLSDRPDCPRTGDYKKSTKVVAFSQAFAIGVASIGWFTYFTVFYLRIDQEKDPNSVHAKSQTVGHWEKEITDLEYRYNISGNSTGSFLKRCRYRIKIRFLRAISEVLRALNKQSYRIRTHLRRCSKIIMTFIKLSGNVLLGVVVGLLFGQIIQKIKKDRPKDIDYGVLVSVFFIASLVVPCVVKKILKSRDRHLKRDRNLEEFVGQFKGVPCRIDYFCNRKKDVEKWIQKGSNKPPDKLRELIKKSTQQGGFGGVARIFASNVPSLDVEAETEEPENCWILPIVTLAYIAIIIPGVPDDARKFLKEAVDQGLKYVRFIEHHLDSSESTQEARKEAEYLWESIKKKEKWYDVDLPNANAYRKLEDLSNKGEEQFKKSTGERAAGKKIAWYTMSKIARSIWIQNFSGDSNIFDQISEIISDTIAACLTNLPRAIYVQCTKSDPVEDIEEEIIETAFIFGETKEFMTPEYLFSPIFSRLQDEMQSNLGDDRRPRIDEWIKGVERLPQRPQDN